MKIRVIALLGLLLTSMATRAQQTNMIYVTGSSVIQFEVIDAIVSLFDNGKLTDLVTRDDAFTGTEGKHAKYSILTGKIQGVTYSVNCLWSTSGAGYAAMAGTTFSDVDFNGNNIVDPDETTYFLNPNTCVGESTSPPSAAETNHFSIAPDMALVEMSQSESFDPGTNFTVFGEGGIVGVIPYLWVKCTNSSRTFAAWSHLTNVTHDQLKVQLAGPNVAAFFTGIASDTNVNVYTIGSSIASSDRIQALCDTGYGVATQVDQWVVDPTGPVPGALGRPFIETVDPTIPGYRLVEVGNAGFQNENAGFQNGNANFGIGPDVAQDLSLDGCASATDPLTGNRGVITLGYLSVSDAWTMRSNSLWLNLNGVAESDDAVAQGQYTFWGYERLVGRPGLSGYELTFGQMLSTAIQNQIAIEDEVETSTGNDVGHNWAISLQLMDCTKASDVAFPTHN